MYYYKEICCGEIVDSLVTDRRDLVEKRIRDGNFIYSTFEVIYGHDVSSQFSE